MLRWFDRMGYIVFDFVPVRSCHATESTFGSTSESARRQAKGQLPCSPQAARGSLWDRMDLEWYLSSPRPSGFEAWSAWIARAATASPLVVTELLAVRRGYLTRGHVATLSSLCLAERGAISPKCPLLANAHRSAEQIYNSPLVQPRCPEARETVAQDPYICI